MPRDIPVGNGQMLVTFDMDYRIRDVYFPHVGMENHTAGHPFRFGFWADGRLSWVGPDWNLDRRYADDTLSTQVTGRNESMGLSFESHDVVDFHMNAFVRRLTVTNHRDTARDVRVFFHHDFHIFGTDVGDTAYFDPNTQSILHYKGERWFLMGGMTPERIGVQDFATGLKAVNGAEGTWRDAEDGELGRNPIAQGAVDSTAGFHLTIPPGSSSTLYYWMLLGTRYDDVERMQAALLAKSPESLLARTDAYWRLWVQKEEFTFEGIPLEIARLFRRSLLVIRTQTDNDGAILAANDSDVMMYSRDHYSYLWPRDGALVADALIRTGYSEPSQRFFNFCGRVLESGGFLLHKYNPDGTLASSWHPWLRNGREALPIQEDETALVVWALWKHFARFREIDFIKPLYRPVVRRMGDFLVRYRDPVTGLPRPSHDLWEERWGVHTFTVAAVIAGLQAAGNFTSAFGEIDASSRYFQAADEIREAMVKHLYNEELGRFARMGTREGDGYKLDMTVDASLAGLFMFEALGARDPRVESTMKAVREKLWVKTKVGGVARYENDYYHQVSRDIENVPGNPWLICTLWMAQYEIARATSMQELERALEYLKWAASRALPSGILAEQVHPYNDTPISVSPLTWSHATFVTTVIQYLEKRLRLVHGEMAPRLMHSGARFQAAAATLHQWDGKLASLAKNGDELEVELPSELD